MFTSPENGEITLIYSSLKIWARSRDLTHLTHLTQDASEYVHCEKERRYLVKSKKWYNSRDAYTAASIT